MIRFKRCFLPLILEGRKTQTRRFEGRYRVGEIYRVNNTEIWILITRRYRQRLGDISPEEIFKEGFSSIEDFRRAWTQIFGSWNPDMQVWAYEFKVISPLHCIYNCIYSRRR